MNTPPPVQINRWSANHSKEKRPFRFFLALILAIIFHVGLFAYLKKIEFFNTAPTKSEEQTYLINTDSPEIPEIVPSQEQTLPEYAEAQEEIAELDELLVELHNQELDINISVEAPQVAINMSLPSKAGELEGALDDIILNTNTDTILEDIGTSIADNTLAAEGQLIIKEGSMQGELLDQRDLIDNTTLQGIGGLSDDGIMNGYSSLDSLLSMSESRLAGSRTALPSDLLYAYDSAELKSEARLGLMKLAMVIERNPKMYCLLEGHSDLFGPASYNQELSLARAQAVKDYLVTSLKLNDAQILVKGYGKSHPLIAEGDQEQQAPNRRVDILMRKQVPKSFYEEVAIPAPTPTPETKPAPTPAAVTTPEPTPQRAIVVETPPAPRVERAPIKPELPPRAIVVEDVPVIKPIRVNPIGDPTARFLELLQERGITPPVRAIVVD